MQQTIDGFTIMINGKKLKVKKEIKKEIKKEKTKIKKQNDESNDFRKNFIAKKKIDVSKISDKIKKINEKK